jgi:hypothetical protein
VQSVRRALLRRLIDHAPLFPPASLPLSEALEDHRRARASAHGWMVARFVCPASRLAQLAGTAFPVSAVLDSDSRRLSRLDGAVHVEAVETQLSPNLDELAAAGREAYVELSPDGRLEARIGELAARGLRAKVRCGGRVIPTVDELARFVRACKRTGVVFKATAGLHHAVRSGDEHGLVNLLAASVFDYEEEALAEDDPGAFTVTDDRFAWRDRTAGLREVARARSHVLASIGSCSFDEPVEELVQLGVLPR